MLDERIIELEIRFSHQGDFLEKLNQVVTDQQKSIERLEKAVLDLKRMVNTSEVEGARSLKDERPPHY